MPTVPLIEGVDGPRKKAYPLNWSEQDRFFGKMPEHLRAATLFAVNTGLRESELCSLTILDRKNQELQSAAWA